jgi:hypothetical protein
MAHEGKGRTWIIIKKPTYKECLMKEVDPLDGQYIDMKIDERFKELYPEWKKDIKEEVLKEVQKEMAEKFEKMKKEYDDFENLLNEDKADVNMEESQDPE